MSAEMETDTHNQHLHTINRFGVIPTPQRLDAVDERRGKGVTIAFLDSGFYPHPDLTQPVDRILAYVDITRPGARLRAAARPQPWAWHGTQTAVVAAGNGELSNGLYRGLAPEAGLVLVKVSDRGRITERNIARGLWWVIENKERFNIRVVSISLGGDTDASYTSNVVDQAAEEAVRRGITVIAAAGNSGCSDRPNTVPPANAPSVITVGGYSDGNQAANEQLELYCSSFGETVDGFVKPEILAPAMWVAAPILPGTPQYKKATILSQLAEAPDYSIRRLTTQLWPEAEGIDSLADGRPEAVRAAVESMIQQEKIISAHYQHVDGTSFAAPIVASVVAQMIEANPRLTPAMIKQILVSTAGRIEGAPLLRQGYGALNARRAVLEAGGERHALGPANWGAPGVEAGGLAFRFHDDLARDVRVAGDFNGWRPEPMRKGSGGIWRVVVESPAPGRYGYKFLVDGETWVEDPSHGMKHSNDFGGLNSTLIVD
ncbi:MAG: S8 family serine peptidase [Acidobacteria bacterium]|nr:S8 family serine peptidase [Acidobacteriota bacterium]